MAVKGERLSISAETLAVGQNFYDQPVFNPLRQLAKSHEVDVLIVYRMATIVAKRITESFRNKADGTLDYIPESFFTNTQAAAVAVEAELKELIEQPPYSIKFDLSEIRLQSLSQEKRLSLMREIVTSMSNEPLWIYYVAVRILNNNAVYSNDGKFINRGKPRKQILPPNFDWWKSERLKRHRVIQEQAPLEGLRSLLPDYGVGNPLSRQPDPGRHPLELKNRRLSKK